jgi:hypothetical protein
MALEPAQLPCVVRVETSVMRAQGLQVRRDIPHYLVDRETGFDLLAGRLGAAAAACLHRLASE